MSATHIKRIGLPLVAAIAVSAAVAAPAVASSGLSAGTGTYKTWTKAEKAAGFKLVQPGTTYGLRNVGHILVSSCETSAHKRSVSAFYGSILKASLSLEQDNAGKACNTSYPGTSLGTYRIHGHPASLYGYCGIGDAPPCTSTDIELWLTWKVKSDFYIASSHDESRSRLVHFATVLKKA